MNSSAPASASDSILTIKEHFEEISHEMFAGMAFLSTARDAVGGMKSENSPDYTFVLDRAIEALFQAQKHIEYLTEVLEVTDTAPKFNLDSYLLSD